MKVENIDYTITIEQEKICKSLQRLLKKAEKEGIFFYDHYGTLVALNGNVVSHLEEEVDYERTRLKDKDPYCNYSEDGFCFKIRNLSPCADDSQVIILKKNYEDFTLD